MELRISLESCCFFASGDLESVVSNVVYLCLFITLGNIKIQFDYFSDYGRPVLFLGYSKMSYLHKHTVFLLEKNQDLYVQFQGCTLLPDWTEKWWELEFVFAFIKGCIFGVSMLVFSRGNWNYKVGPQKAERIVNGFMNGRKYINGVSLGFWVPIEEKFHPFTLW